MIATDSTVIGPQAEALLARAAADVIGGDLPGCALTVLREGEVVLDAAIGTSLDSTWHLWSVSKGLTSALVANLVSRGELDVDIPVCEILEWFTGDGKELVTVDQLLLHTAGLATAPMPNEVGVDRTRRRERMQSWRTTTPPGEVNRYHHTSAHWVLGSIVEHLLGQSFAQSWHERVATPLGLTSTSFAPDPADPRRQHLRAVGEPTSQEMKASLLTQGFDLDAIVGEASVDQLLTFNRPEVLRAGSPGAGAIGTPREVARMYAALMSGDDRIWSDAVRRDFTSTVRTKGPVAGLGIAANRSRGFDVAGADGHAAMRELPSSLSPDAFGASGACGQIAWADPSCAMAFCYATNGLHRDPLNWFTRVNELNNLAAAI